MAPCFASCTDGSET